LTGWELNFALLQPTQEPLVFASWNANSIGNRFKEKEDKEAIRGFLEKHKPDMFTIQEVRCESKYGSPSARE
jgi:exonuclease III